VGLILFLITLIFNTFGNWLVRKNQAWLSSALVAKADVVASTALLSSNRIDQTIEAVSHSPHHTEKSVVFAPAFGTREAIGRLFHGFALVCTLAGIGFLGVIIYQNVVSGLPKLDWQFLTSFQSIDPEKAGILVPLAGTFVITILTALFVIPIGVGGAIFLEEYLQDSWWKRVIDVQIANLSAVPSIIYGLLGLGLFVRLQQIIANDNQVGRNVLSAALTLTLIVLPVQIISTRTALQNIPDSLRYAAYALGMSKWQMIWRVVLPTATPAITTGALLALTVAIGETAALIAVGSVKTITILPTSLDSQFLTLPVQIYYWNTEGEKFEAINSAAIITLIAILLVISFSTVLIRNLFMRKIR
jgi:phosphate ABC transporter permease subunit PstA